VVVSVSPLTVKVEVEESVTVIVKKSTVDPSTVLVQAPVVELNEESEDEMVETEPLELVVVL
jgi:hypothetical protein